MTCTLPRCAARLVWSLMGYRRAPPPADMIAEPAGDGFGVAVVYLSGRSGYAACLGPRGWCERLCERRPLLFILAPLHGGGVWPGWIRYKRESQAYPCTRDPYLRAALEARRLGVGGEG